MENINIESTWDTMFQMAKQCYWLVVVFFVLGVLFLFLLPPLGLFLILAPFVYFYLEAHKKFMSSFAQANNMTYLENGAVKNFHGRLFSVGDSRAVINVIAGVWNNFPIKIFNYSYTVGSGKNRSTYFFTVMEIAFENIKFPFIFLKSKSMWSFYTTFLGNNVSVPIHNDSFTLSIIKGYEVEALQIFSEQLLEYLAQNAKNFSIEFSENKINIYDDKTISNKKDLLQLLDVGKLIIDSSGAFISRLSDDFAALHPYYAEK